MKIKNKKNIAILMATYNGATFLAEQIESIISQSYTDWTLYISDDCSSDNTLDIVSYYTSKYEFIYNIPNNVNRGSRDNFLFLLDSVESNYYMFSDQDDVWLPFKIEKSFKLLKQQEAITPNKPLLVHTNSSIVNKRLEVIERSYWNKIRINPDKLKTINFFSVLPFTQGATLLFNNDLKQVSFPVSPYSRMHDAWLGYQTLKNEGVIISCHTPTILYRQHEKNVIGVNVGYKNSFMFKMTNIPRILSENRRNYQKLKNIGFGNYLKYIYIKLKILVVKLFYTE